MQPSGTSRRAARQQRDEELMVETQRVFDDNAAVYGHRKVCAQLNVRR